jgi:hypothetical protein
MRARQVLQLGLRQWVCESRPELRSSNLCGSCTDVRGSGPHVCSARPDLCRRS